MIEQQREPTLEETLSTLDKDLDRLRALYEQYFAGIEKRPPVIPRRNIEKALRILRREKAKYRTAIRFRINMLVQKYQTYALYWERVMRQLEEGTYRRRRGYRSESSQSVPKADAGEVDERQLDELELAEAEFPEMEAFEIVDVESPPPQKEPIPVEIEALAGGEAKIGEELPAADLGQALGAAATQFMEELLGSRPDKHGLKEVVSLSKPTAAERRPLPLRSTPPVASATGTVSAPKAEKSVANIRGVEGSKLYQTIVGDMGPGSERQGEVPPSLPKTPQPQQPSKSRGLIETVLNEGMNSAFSGIFGERKSPPPLPTDRARPVSSPSASVPDRRQGVAPQRDLQAKSASLRKQLEASQRAPRPKATPTGPLPDQRDRSLYEQYVSATRSQNPEAKPPDFESFSRSVHRQRQIHQNRYGKKDVDYRISVKNGKVTFVPVFPEDD